MLYASSVILIFILNLFGSPSTNSCNLVKILLIASASYEPLNSRYKPFVNSFTCSGMLGLSGSGASSKVVCGKLGSIVGAFSSIATTFLATLGFLGPFVTLLLSFGGHPRPFTKSAKDCELKVLLRPFSSSAIILLFG